MIAALAVLEETDWGALSHAYGVAADAPSRLTGLLSGDPAACADAVGYLDAAILHQGSIYPATAPVALFVAGILSDPRTAVQAGGGFSRGERVPPPPAAPLAGVWPGGRARPRGAAAPRPRPAAP